VSNAKLDKLLDIALYRQASGLTIFNLVVLAEISSCNVFFSMYKPPQARNGIAELGWQHL